MKMTVKTCLGLVLVTLLSGCGKDDDSPAKNVIEEIKQRVQEPKLMKTWEQSECKDTVVPFDASMREYVKFAGNDFFREVEYYDKGNCQDPLVRVKYTGTFDLGDKKPDIDDARDIQYKVNKVQMIPLKDKGVEFLKVAKLCGISDWALNTAKDVSAQSGQRTCPVDRVPVENFDLVKVDGNHLYTGKTQGDTNAPNLRPSALDRDEFYQESEHKIED